MKHELKPHCDDPGCLVMTLISTCTRCGAEGVTGDGTCFGPVIQAALERHAKRTLSSIIRPFEEALLKEIRKI